MNSSIILKKDAHWYIIPSGTDENNLILELIAQENPHLLNNTDANISELIAQAGWEIEEYRDFAVVA